MKTHVSDHIEEVATPAPLAQLRREPVALLPDAGPGDAALRRHQQLADSSPQAMQLTLQARMLNPTTPHSPQELDYPARRMNEEKPLQERFDMSGSASATPAQREAKPNMTGLPDQVKSGIESLSGMSMDHVKVHYNSDKPSQLQAHAYAQGSEIYVAPGQEQHVPHEAWHVVQQAQGRVRPTMQLKGSEINDDANLEQEADLMGDKALFCAATVVNSRPNDEIKQRSQCNVQYAAPAQFTKSIKNNYSPINHHLLQRATIYHPGDPNDEMDAPNKFDLAKSKLDLPVRSESQQKTKTEIAKIADLTNIEIGAAIAQSEDTHALHEELGKIKVKFSLLEIEMIELGTPNAAVRFRVNPWFYHIIPAGKIIWRMIGRGAPPVADVHWESESLTIGKCNAKVGTLMIAKPLAPDHESGSISTYDSHQDNLMSQLPNSGTTAVGNDQKYIKGHLLNDHLGGVGAYFNLFPITADANAKHLAFIEKFVKAQLKAGYVVIYEVKVDNIKPQNSGGTSSWVDADFSFYWTLLDTSGKPLSKQHIGNIESRYNAKGNEPFDVTQEYIGEYDKINRGKSTPNAIAQSGQWKESGYSQIGMAAHSIPPHTTSSLQLPTSYFNKGSSSSASATPSPLDFTDIKIKADVVGIQYISVRSNIAPPVSATGSLMNVGPASTPSTETIKSISPMGGGWTRIYF